MAIRVRRFAAALLFIFQYAVLQAATVSRTLYINRGTFTTVSGSTFPFFAFNDTSVFDPLNSVVQLLVNDVLDLTVVNNDTVAHGFALLGTGPIFTIAPADSITTTYTSTLPVIVIYYDPLNAPDFHAAGLAGMICFTPGTEDADYFWNIKEHQTGYNDSIAAGVPVDWNAYRPDYFTINGRSFPDLQLDPTATILQNVGDTIFIFVANTGRAKHSLHFHGFHPEVIYSSDPWIQVGSAKDTWPMKPMSALLLQLVPDKLGRYSVHDHNLVAVSGGGVHPNGMFTIMEIQ